MKNFVIAVVANLAMTTVVLGQQCPPIVFESWCAAPIIYCGDNVSPYAGTFVQEPTPAKSPTESSKAVTANQDSATPSSVLVTPAPEVQMSSADTNAAPGPVVRGSSRWQGGNSMVRRRGFFLGRFLNRNR